MGLLAACFGCVQEEPGDIPRKETCWGLLHAHYTPQLTQEAPEQKMVGAGEYLKLSSCSFPCTSLRDGSQGQDALKVGLWSDPP